jgi:hypothetical protein
MSRLVDALDNKVPDVRLAALDSLERVHPADSPEADLTALGSEHADVRRKSLVRLFQRKMLGHPPVQAALRRRGEDADPEVRRTSFLLALHTRPKLVNALRARDPEMQRQLTELESGNLPPVATAPAAKPTNPATPTPPAGGFEIPAFLRPQLESIAAMQGVAPERLFEALGLAARSNNPRDFVMALTTKLQEIIAKARETGEGS